MPRMTETAQPERSLRRGETATVRIDSLTHEGRGVTRVGGKVLFVADALPGELVDATVVRRRRNHDEARLETLHEAAPQRVEPRCAWFGTCGGCSLQHLDAATQIGHKQRWLLDSLERIGSVTPRTVLEPLRGPLWGYRRRARLGVKYVDGKGRVLVGFRERHKPFVTDMRGCEVLVPAAAALIEPLQQLIGALSIRRRVPQIEVAGGDQQLVLVLRVLDAPQADDLGRLEEFARVHDVTIALQTGGPDSVVALDGSVPKLHYSLPAHDVSFEFLATDFVQINGPINRALVDAVIAHLAPAGTDHVLDLFCGLGNITLPLARRCAAVVGIEGSDALVARARANALRNGIANADFVAADLAAEPAQLPALRERYDLVVLDPPRSGAEAVCEVLLRMQPRRIVYVSCHPATLARDAALLTRRDHYALSAAGVMDMFPHTAHVESLAVFERVP